MSGLLSLTLTRVGPRTRPAAHLFRVALADCPSGLRKGFSGKIEYHCHHFGGGLVFLATDLIGLPGCAVVSEEQVKMS